MTDQRDPHTLVPDQKPAWMLGDRLRLMFDWYRRSAEPASVVLPPVVTVDAGWV